MSGFRKIWPKGWPLKFESQVEEVAQVESHVIWTSELQKSKKYPPLEVGR